MGSDAVGCVREGTARTAVTLSSSLIPCPGASPALTAPAQVCNRVEFVTQAMSTENNNLCPLPSQKTRTVWKSCCSVHGLSAAEDISSERTVSQKLSAASADAYFGELVQVSGNSHRDAWVQLL